MTGLVVATTGALGVYLLYTAVAFGWTGVGFSPRPASVDTPTSASGTANRRILPGKKWLDDAGLENVRPAEFVSVMSLLFVVGALLAFALFGGALPALVSGIFGATLPLASSRNRREQRRRLSSDAWPRLIEEIRLLTGGAGRSLPQALLEVGRRAPADLRPAFAAAEREWLITTDFGRATTVLRAKLADPTADAVCETLLVAHEIGGSDVDRRLAALVEDRTQDQQGRRDAYAKQAGVRFARRFVLVVPIGMALAGLSIGTGREAYQTPIGQVLVAFGLLVIVGCWAWAGRLLRLPDQERVF